MAYTPSNKLDDLAKAQLRADTAITADSYNLTPDFFEKNKAIFKKINTSVSNIVRTYGFNNRQNADIINPLKNYNRVLFDTISKQNLQNDLISIKPSNLDSGIRSLSSEETHNNVEESIINTFQKISSESFALMDEYSISCSLIPELKRVIKLIVRDIINANEITKRSIHDVYTKPDDDTDETTEDVEIINKIIDTEITDKYKIEQRLEVWLYEALVVAAKPILVLPYRDIVKQAIALSKAETVDGSYNLRNNNYKMSMESVERDIDQTMSIEAFNDFAYESIDPFKLNKALKSDTVLQKPSYTKSKYKYQSAEDLNNYTKKFNDFIGDIIDDDIVNQIYSSGMEELYSSYDYEKKLADNELETCRTHGLEADEDRIYETVNSMKSFINKLDGKSEDADEEEEKESIESDIKKRIKERLSEFVQSVDKNIEIVDDDFAGLSLTKNSIMRNLKKRKNNKKFIDGIYVKEIDQLNEFVENFDKEVLIEELNPKYVIPISIGSEHIQYYIFEAEAYEGAQTSNSRKTNSFASIVASTGLGNDSAVINASNGISLVPNDPAASSIFSPSVFGNTNMNLEGNDLMEHGSKIDILKQIVFRTLSKRMSDPSLVDNKSFTDAIINLMRQGYIVNRKIKFTCVPATNIVYFAHDIDDKGMPHSILDGTLLQIYMYLAGIVSMTMSIVDKSSSAEKLEVNMGMSHQIGMTLMEIQKQLSTRNIHVKSFFNNIGSVLRNVATYARYTMPVVDGEKLYDVNTIDKSSESPIDTDFIEKRLTSILSSLPAPPAILNMMQEAEFSRSIINQNLEYRNSINEKQFKFGKDLTKLYRLIALYSRLSKPITTDEKELISQTKDIEEHDRLKLIKIKNINPKFVSPMYLNMTNISETFTNIEPVIDSFSKYIFGEDANTPLDQFMIRRFKRECVKIFAGNIDLTYVEDIAEKIKRNPWEGVSEEVKSRIIAKKSEGLLSGEDTGEGAGSDSTGEGDDMSW